MRYSLSLPLAVAAFAASPVMAQDGAVPPPDQAPPTAEQAMPPEANPLKTAPVDTAPADNAPVDTAEPATSTEMVEAPSDAATPPPAEPAATPAPADTMAPEAAPMPATSAAALTAEQRAAYDGWPSGTKAYFDGLTPARQTLFLRIADPDRAKLVALDAAQQEKVWASLEQQDAAQKDKPKR